MTLSSKIETFLNSAHVETERETQRRISSFRTFVSKWLSLILSVVAGGSVIYGFVKTQDLKSYNAALELSLSNARIGLWTLDVRSNVVTWDETMFKIYKSQPTENGVVDYNFFDKFVVDEDRDRVKSEVYAAIHDKKPFITYFLIKDGTGKQQLIRASGVMLNDNTMQGINILTKAHWDDEVTRDELEQLLQKLREPL